MEQSALVTAMGMALAGEIANLIDRHTVDMTAKQRLPVMLFGSSSIMARIAAQVERQVLQNYNVQGATETNVMVASLIMARTFSVLAKRERLGLPMDGYLDEVLQEGLEDHKALVSAGRIEDE